MIMLCFVEIDYSSSSISHMLLVYSNSCFESYIVVLYYYEEQIGLGIDLVLPILPPKRPHTDELIELIELHR